MYLGRVLVVSVLCAVCQADEAALQDTEKLSFVENVYVTFSTACRALMDLQYSTPDKNQSEVVKRMRIVYLNHEKLLNLNIDEAFVALTNPALYDISRQTKVIIHGFNDHAQSSIPLSLARAYIDKNMFNVLLVDAGDIIKEKYLQSVHRARLLGRRLANLLANLENYGASAADMHVIGISLGAHVAGWAGKYFRRYKARRLGRITGLDPAGPCYSYADGELRLDRDDADYVDVIHVNRPREPSAQSTTTTTTSTNKPTHSTQSSAKVSARLVQGVLEPLGHADFYVNGGGPHQPGCLSPSCSHQRASHLFEESIRAPKSFIGVKCSSWREFEAGACDDTQLSVMGYGSSAASRGVFYLRTGAGAPYGLAMDGIRPAPNYVEALLRMPRM